VSAEDDESSGRPSTRKTTENVEEVREFIHEDRRRTNYELGDIVGISNGVCQQIITENLNMRSITSLLQRARPHIPENYRVCD
jgi:hypothetical protein